MFMDWKLQYCQDASSFQLPTDASSSYRFDAISIKIPASHLVDSDELILKFIWRGKRPRIANMILKEKNEVGGLTLPDFKTYCKAIVIKTVWW